MFWIPLGRYGISTICPVRIASFAAIVQLAECEAVSGPQRRGEPVRIADAQPLISYVLGEIVLTPALDCCDFAVALPPAC